MSRPYRIPGGFTPLDFRRRREAILDRLGSDVMVLPAVPPPGGAGGSRYAYRPNGFLFYLTGFTEPDAVLVLNGGADEHRAVLFLQPRDPDAERWSGVRLGPEGARDSLGLEEAHPIAEVGTRLPEVLRTADRVHYRFGGPPAVDAAVWDALLFGRTRGTRTGKGPRILVDPGLLLEPMRMRKEPGEIQLLRRAAELTVEGFAAALPLARPGEPESRVQARLEEVFRKNGAPTAFATIVAAGANACILHYVENRAVIQEGDLVLVDAGAERELYVGDVSRTVPASGTFTEAQRVAYEVVARAHAAGVAAAVPGAPVSAVHNAAVAEITAGLVDMGVLTGTLSELVSEGAYKPFYPHPTSHWLGLEVHDAGVYGIGGEPVVLEPGMVLTVEPGLYFSAGADGTPPAFAGLGIRLEDDVLVTPDGPENLTESLALDPGAVEDLMAG